METYADVLRATVEGLVSLNRTSLDLALAAVGATRRAGGFVLLDGDHRKEPLRGELRQQGFVRLHGAWTDAAEVEHVEPFFLLRSMTERSLSRLVHRYRCQVVALRDVESGSRVTLFPGEEEVVLDQLDPDLLATEVATRKGARSFFLSS